jgi:shikimate dehydrogenase
MTTDLYAVIGQPIAHSLSPRIHAAFAAQFGADLSYGAIEVAPEALADTLRRMHGENYQGMNVTLPHKTGVAALCEQVSARAQLAGAVNTLMRTGSGWAGDNTDGEGLMRDLARLGYAVSGQRVLLLGAGGAARGILKPLLDMKPAELTLSNRNPWKPEELAEQFKAHGRIRPCTHIALKGDRYDLILNATSAGHSGQWLRLPGQLLAEGGACYDLSYGKAHAPFAEWARAQEGTRIADGLGMLIEQAAEAFRLWRGQRPDTAPVLALLRPSGTSSEGSDPAAAKKSGRSACDRETHGDPVD